MAEKQLFEFVKGLMSRRNPEAEKAEAPVARRSPNASFPPPAPDPDTTNPATIVRVGTSTDGRELIMTQGLGTVLVDRETPSICFYQHGHVSAIPQWELQRFHDLLMQKRQVKNFVHQYVDLLNVVTLEIENRARGEYAASPVAPPPTRPARRLTPSGMDKDNPATILRLGRSHDGAVLLMTKGLGTFVLHREAPTLRYFDRGREWDLSEAEIQLLIDLLMAKEEMSEHRHAYIDLLNVATFMLESRFRK